MIMHPIIYSCVYITKYISLSLVLFGITKNVTLLKSSAYNCWLKLTTDLKTKMKFLKILIQQRIFQQNSLHPSTNTLLVHKYNHF